MSCVHGDVIWCGNCQPGAGPEVGMVWDNEHRDGYRNPERVTKYTPGRPRMHRSDADRQRVYRARKRGSAQTARA